MTRKPDGWVLKDVATDTYGWVIYHEEELEDEQESLSKKPKDYQDRFKITPVCLVEPERLEELEEIERKWRALDRYDCKEEQEVFDFLRKLDAKEND